jgi:catechol 2,3-dioxygenase-like lactoylglutathione lyase family enzyme
MRFAGPVLVVRDIKTSQKFYETVLSQTVLLDFDGNLVFSSGFSLQAQDIWCAFINSSDEEILKNSKNFELYFEEDDFDAFLMHLETFDSVTYVNTVTEYSWGQRVVRFYDPDCHIIEVGESMTNVARKFVSRGLSLEEVATRIQHPVEFVKAALEA